MKRLLRILARALIVLSLMACLAAAALSIRSYWGTDYLSRVTPVPATIGGVGVGAIAHHENKISCTRGTMRFSDGDYQVELLLSEPTAAVTSAESARWSWGRLGVGHFGWETPTARSFANRLGSFSYSDGLSTSFSDSSEHVWTIPAWLPVFAFAIAPMIALLRLMRKRRRRLLGHCPRCNYDLRATPDRCPECGMVRS